MGKDWQKDVLEFHQTFGVPARQHPTLPAKDQRKLRKRLIREEVEHELMKAIDDGDLPRIADGIVDSIYVLIGCAIVFGIEIQPVWDLVHSANMRKVGANKRGDGKVLKPEGWEPPNVQDEIHRQETADEKKI